MVTGLIDCSIRLEKLFIPEELEPKTFVVPPELTADEPKFMGSGVVVPTLGAPLRSVVCPNCGVGVGVDIVGGVGIDCVVGLELNEKEGVVTGGVASVGG